MNVALYTHQMMVTHVRSQVTVILTKMLFHKIRLHGCNPVQDAGDLSEETCESLFLVAIEVIELNYKLRTDPRTRPWLWLFSSYTQWHAFSLVLVWLRMEPLRRNSRRAWEAVEKAIVLRWEHPTSLLNGKRPQQWRFIIRLLEKARSARRNRPRNRVRQGPEKPRCADQASLTGLSSSASTTRPEILIQKPLAGETDRPNLSSRQTSTRLGPQCLAPQQATDIPSGRSDTVAPSSPATNSDISIPARQINEINPGSWVLSSQNAMDERSDFGINCQMSDPDLLMVDGHFSMEDFQGLEDLAFLNELIY